MAHKQLLFNSAAREKVLRGATALADAVRVTLGPKSKCVLIEKPRGRPLVCNDGVMIAKEVELKDPEENLGDRMMREAAERTGEAVGDGTSTAIILAHASNGRGAMTPEQDESTHQDGEARTVIHVKYRPHSAGQGDEDAR